MILYVCACFQRSGHSEVEHIEDLVLTLSPQDASALMRLNIGESADVVTAGLEVRFTRVSTG